MQRTILVSDGEQRAALACVRSLGQAGHRVFVCSPREQSLAGASRHCAGEYQVPDPLADAAGFVDAVARLCTQMRVDVAMPVSEAALLAVLPLRDRITARLPFASLDDVRAICDKARVLAAATTHGIAVPTQVVAHAPEDAARWSGPFPVVLKPSRSVVASGDRRIKTSVSYASDPRQLAAALDATPREAYPVLLQHRVVGPGTAISVLVWDGKLRAAFAHRRIREKPPSGGVSVVREAIPLDRALLDRSVALLGDFNWQGVAMVEFKVDAGTETPYLMEINGRLWGSLQLAIDAGVDFPRLLVAAAVNESGPPVLEYRAGTRTRWEWGDVDHLVARLRHSAAELELSPDAPSRLRTVGAFLGSFVSSKGEVLRPGDPRPFLRETADWFRRR